MTNTPAAVLAHSIPDAARILGIGRTKLYELIDSGELRTFRLGSRRLVPDTELQRIVTERMQAAA
jgi:excisionase family DNA binding protein